MLRTLRSTTTMFALLAAGGYPAVAQNVAPLGASETAPRIQAEVATSAAPAAPGAPEVPVIKNAEPVTAIPTSPAVPSETASASDTKPAVAAPAMPPAPVAIADPRLSLDVAAALARMTSVEKADADALVAFYGERQGAALWVDGKGRTPAATSAIAFMEKAALWGLDPKDYTLPAAPVGDGVALDQLAADEVAISLAMLKYARNAKGGRTEPLAITKFLDRKPQTIDAKALLASLATANDPVEVLKGQHPQHAGFRALREKLAQMLGGESETAQVTIPNGPILRPGDKHAQIALVTRPFTPTAS